MRRHRNAPRPRPRGRPTARTRLGEQVSEQTHGLIGEIQLWRGEFTSPRWWTAESFFQIVATLATLSLERARLAELNHQPA